MSILGYELELWPFLVGLCSLLASTVAAGHAVLNKDDVRAAIGWTVWIIFLPVIGPLSYLVLGVNRVQRKAAARRSGLLRYPEAAFYWLGLGELVHRLPAEDAYLGSLARAVGSIAPSPLTGGNLLRTLGEGEAAYEQMLQAIGQAQHSVGLATYLFDFDPAGAMFRQALAAAHRRGVQVRVLIDAVGERYSWGSTTKALRQEGVRCALFMQTRVPWRMPYANLRNHRKLLVVDGELAFTGGMNIRDGHRLRPDSRHPVRDLHFRVEGPVVATLRQVFAEDWTFTTGERLSGTAWFPELQPQGELIARALPDGPDEDLGHLHWTLLAALGTARRSIRILTPYFLPDLPLSTALVVAARRGVEVEILLPAVCNLKLVGWASRAGLAPLLEAGCRVYLSPPPFDHSKLVLIDDAWVLIGSANWDPRSLRLNFELNVECYDRSFASSMAEQVQRRLQAARELSLEELVSQPLPVRLRDGAARLLSPYL